MSEFFRMKQSMFYCFQISVGLLGFWYLTSFFCGLCHKDMHKAISKVRHDHGIILNQNKLGYYVYKQMWPEIAYKVDRGDIFWTGSTAYFSQFLVSTNSWRKTGTEYAAKLKAKYEGGGQNERVF